MKIGDLRFRVDIQASTKAPDAQGGFPATWVSVLDTGTTVAASIIPLTSNELMKTANPAMIATHKCRIRFRRALSPSWRIVWAGRNFNIVSITDFNMQHRWIDMLLKESK